MMRGTGPIANPHLASSAWRAWSSHGTMLALLPHITLASALSASCFCASVNIVVSNGGRSRIGVGLCVFWALHTSTTACRASYLWRCNAWWLASVLSVFHNPRVATGKDSASLLPDRIAAPGEKAGESVTRPSPLAGLWDAERKARRLRLNMEAEIGPPVRPKQRVRTHRRLAPLA